jgi:hypothetical protein
LPTNLSDVSLKGLRAARVNRLADRGVHTVEDLIAIDVEAFAHEVGSGFSIRDLQAVVDAGACAARPTTVVDLTGDTPTLTMRPPNASGSGDMAAFLDDAALIQHHDPVHLGNR